MYVHHKHVCLSVHSGVLLRRRQVRVVRYLCQKAGRSITSWKKSNLRDTIAPLEGKGEWNTETIAYVYQNSGFQQGIAIYFSAHLVKKIQHKHLKCVGGFHSKRKYALKIFISTEACQFGINLTFLSVLQSQEQAGSDNNSPLEPLVFLFLYFVQNRNDCYAISFSLLYDCLQMKNNITCHWNIQQPWITC